MADKKGGGRDPISESNAGMSQKTVLYCINAHPRLILYLDTSYIIERLVINFQ